MAAAALFEYRCTFGVRNDKFRGLVVESLQTPDGNDYFFKYHDQSLSKHCEQFQILVKTANVQRAKKLQVDIAPFLHEYVRVEDSAVIFRGTKLKSVVEQIEKVYSMRINKEMGIEKRKQTMATKKQEKIDAHNEKIKSRYAAAEAEYQAERARRIDALFTREPAPQGDESSKSGDPTDSNMTE